MLHLLNHSSLSISAEESHSLIKFQILSNCLTFKLFQWFFQKLFLERLFAYACNQFSLTEHHSRFSSLLSFFIPFLWFTCGLFSGFGINACATKRWTNFKFLFHKSNDEYHFGFLYIDNNLQFISLQLKDNTRHKLLILYNPSYQMMSFQISVSIFFIVML